MSDLLQRAVAPSAPFVGENSSGKSEVRKPVGVHAFDVQPGQTLKVRVPRGLCGGFVEALAFGSRMRFGLVWGTSGVDLDFDARSTIDVDGSITSSALRGGTLLDGTPKGFVLPRRPQWVLDEEDLWLCVVAQQAGELEFYATEGFKQVQ